DQARHCGAAHKTNIGTVRGPGKSFLWIKVIHPSYSLVKALMRRNIYAIMGSNQAMELYQLRSFAAVAELGHLTRAAEKLHISQPAVSAQIKALEDELGVTLFERVSSGMQLTSAGRNLLPAAEQVLGAANAL